MNEDAQGTASEELDPAPTESEAGEGQENETESNEGQQEEEKVTLTKAELQYRENKAYAKAKAKAERKLERRMAEIEVRIAEQINPNQPGKLTRDMFANDDDYAEANRRLGVAEAKRELSQQAEQRKAVDFVKKASAAPGFDAEVFDTLTISEAMKDALLDSDVGDKVLAWLTQNPDEADRIAEYGAVRQIKEMAKLEVELSTKKPAKQTNAPPVGTKVGSGGANLTTAYKTNPDSLSDEQYYKARQAEIRSRYAGR
jgi:hypothetical protein